MATDIIARGMITEYKSGTNINFAENEDGSVTISASGSISSEDSVARDAINNHKLDKSNPHNVTPAQIGLGNVDNTSDLDKPISTAVQKAIDNKADKTVATTSADGLMSAEDKGKLDAFEITTTGGKLHNKDIATTDLIPTTLPANGGNADTVDGLHANEIATNPNLLINPDFRVNQQGKSEYIGTTECWDKWIVSEGWFTVRSSNDDAAIFTCRTPKVNSWVVSQNIPNYKDYRGKTVTFSAYVITGSAKFNLMINDGVDQAITPVTTGHFSVTYRVSDNATILWCVICTDGQEVENEQIAVISTKLEFGTIATTFVPPNPSIELAKVRAVNNYKPYVTGEEGCGHIVTASVKDYQIFNFTPSAVICQIADGSAFFATIIQNGFRVSLFPNASEKILKYIAFK